MHCTQGMAWIDPMQQRAQAGTYGLAPGVQCLITAADTLWCLGYPAQAIQRSQEALALAQAVDHNVSLAFTYCWAAILYQQRREAPATQAQADALVTLAQAHGLP